MAVDPNWHRWIHASVHQHVANDLSAHYPVFIEGQQRITSKDTEQKFELRVDGPTFTIPSKGCYLGRVEVNVLCNVPMTDSDYSAPHRMAGLAAANLANAICVFRLGDGPEDDQSFLGRLTLLQEEGDRLETNHLGQIGPKTKIVQVMVESHYLFELVT